MQRLWEIFDSDHSRKLEKEEFSKFLQFVGVFSSRFDDIFRRIDSDKSGKIEFEEFIAFYRELTDSSELEQIFNQYSTCNAMNLKQFTDFMTEHQNESCTLEDIIYLILLVKPKENQVKAKIDDILSKDIKIRMEHLSEQDMTFLSLNLVEFKNIVTHEINSIFCFSDRESEQDMTQPLPHYFMNSTHNTYAAEHQLYGDSSVDMYNYAINEGCKLFELDCYDGEDGEPKITHGNTLMSSIPLRKVFEALATNAFKFSPFPVVLSIENHMAEETQVKMKELAQTILKNIFVLKEDELPENYPSPEELKEHFIFKMSRTRLNKTEIKEEESKIEKVKNTSTKIFDLIGLIGVSLKVKEDNITYFPWEIGNIEEKKACKLAEDESVVTRLVRLNKAFFTKVYPDGLRFNSSNFDPICAWSMGCQVAALNIQTHDTNCLLNKGMFSRNRNQGYVLKPLRMRSETSESLLPSEAKFKIRFELLSALFLGHLLGDSGNKRLQFVFRLRGNKYDNANEDYKTAVIDKNFLNHKLTDNWEFSVFDEELSFLVVEATDGSTVIASNCVPISSLKIGVRNLTFLNSAFKPVKESVLILSSSITK